MENLGLSCWFYEKDLSELLPFKRSGLAAKFQSLCGRDKVSLYLARQWSFVAL